MTQKNRTISTRISMPMNDRLEKIVDNIQKPKSHILKDALYSYLERHQDIELEGLNKQIIQNREKYLEAERNKRFRELENDVIRERVMRDTFLEFMDGFLAQIYISNKEYIEHEELKDMMQDSLRVLQNRAEHAGFIEKYENRLEAPIEYATEYLERKTVEDHAFESSDFNPLDQRP